MSLDTERLAHVRFPPRVVAVADRATFVLALCNVEVARSEDLLYFSSLSHLRHRQSLCEMCSAMELLRIDKAFRLMILHLDTEKRWWELFRW